jgi:hypothetical protein
MEKYKELRKLVLEFYDTIEKASSLPPYSNTNEQVEAGYWRHELGKIINIIGLKHEVEVERSEEELRQQGIADGIIPVFAEGRTSKQNKNGKWVIEDCIVECGDGKKRKILQKHIGLELDNCIFRYVLSKEDLKEWI